jgi:hypothetical protein
MMNPKTGQRLKADLDTLEQGGMSYHRSEPGNPKHNPERVLAKREEIKKNFWHIKSKLSLVK